MSEKKQVTEKLYNSIYKIQMCNRKNVLFRSQSMWYSKDMIRIQLRCQLTCRKSCGHRGIWVLEIGLWVLEMVYSLLGDGYIGVLLDELNI